MRSIDRVECEALGRTPKQALRYSLLNSSKAWTALVDGEAEAMFGVVVSSALTGEASPWFLGSNVVYRHPRALMMWGPGLIERLCDSTMTLRNIVSQDNVQAIRLLKRWGFSVGSDPVSVGGMAFLPFEKVAG